jgi:hypothetical protein
MCHVSTEPIKEIPSTVTTFGSIHSLLPGYPVNLVGFNPSNTIRHDEFQIGLSMSLLKHKSQLNTQ